MLKLIALSLAMLTSDAAVTGLSVQPAADRTEVVIGIDGIVTASHFTLENPNRIVLDLVGLTTVRASQHTIDRGGVLRLRVGQFDENTVRVVVDLSNAVDYRVDQDNGAVRVSFLNPEGEFAAWNSGVVTPAPVVAEPATVRAAPQTQRVNAAGQGGMRMGTETPDQPRSRPMVPQQQSRLVTVTFTDEPVANVLSTFAEFANRSIIPAQDVKSKVITAEVRGQPWDIALEAILMANNMYAREMENGVLLVEDGAQLARKVEEEPLVSRQYQILYVSADSLVETVRAMLTTGKGKASANKSSNSLLVTDVPSVLNRIEPLIQQLDVRMPQVNIAATIAFVDRTALEELGISYDVKDSRGTQLNSMVSGYIDENGDGVFQANEATSQDVILLGGNSIAALGNANFPVPNAALKIATSLVLGRHTLISFLEALQQVTLSDIQAKPVVTVMNHRQAEIQVGQRTPVRVIDLGSQGGGGGGGQQSSPIATVDYQDTGVILRVTPHITGDQVLLDIHAERSDAVPSSSDVGFVFTTQNARTQVLVRDGETTVIGGLTITEKSRVRTGIPLLMDLPVLGALFRHTRESENKRDLLIMVTPHIIRN
ncbi:MAG TPA: AMIN domain-containing protein [Longimicrobiales bacterium]|nr:AMIN domain-containing protein [Longimicrobiales bacterium]